MIYYMCFIYILAITFTVSDKLVQIYHKGPNLTFLTFKMTLRVTAHHLYFRTALTSPQMKLHGARNLGSTSVPLNNIDKYVKRGHI